MHPLYNLLPKIVFTNKSILSFKKFELKTFYSSILDYYSGYGQFSDKHGLAVYNCKDKLGLGIFKTTFSIQISKKSICPKSPMFRCFFIQRFFLQKLIFGKYVQQCISCLIYKYLITYRPCFAY